MAVAKKRGLGRGLDALLGGGSAPTASAGLAGELRMLPIEQIEPGKYQPRRHWDDAALDELRSAGSDGRKAIAKLEARYRETTGINTLKIKHNAVLGYFVEVPARHGDSLMAENSGFTHRQTLAGVVRFNSAELHEEAFRAFGGCCRYVVLDNLREGVIRPDWYEPGLNPVYAALLAHYGVVADPCRVRDPNRKGTVESAIQHTQGTALKGRTFESIEAQNAWLVEWEDRWASRRIHGRKKRQVLELYREEEPHLLPLPLVGFRYFTQGVRTVDDAGLVQIEGAYYAAGEAVLASVVTVRVYAHAIEILDRTGAVLRRHQKALRKGAFVMAESDRLFNPSRETARVLARAAQIGPQTAALAQVLFARLGRPGQRALYGLVSLPRTYARADIEAVCERLLTADCVSYSAIKAALARRAEAATQAATAVPALTQSGPGIRALTEYQTFWEQHATDEASDVDAAMPASAMPASAMPVSGVLLSAMPVSGVPV